MGLQWNLVNSVQGDYQYVDGLEAISIYRPSTEETWDDDVKALSYDSERNPVNGTLRILNVRRVWHVFMATLPDDFEFVEHDEITGPDGYTWIVQSWESDTLRGSAVCFRVVCIRKKATT